LEKAEKDFLKVTKTSHETLPRPYDGFITAPVPKSDGNECYQNLKANFLSLYPGKTVRSILFCSTAYGDGCTTTAFNFASTLTEDLQSKVLVIDTNLRAPHLHDICRIGNTPGLSDHMESGDEPILPVLLKGLSSLYIIPCGSSKSAPVNLFEGRRFSEFLGAMRERFDYVILDGPPLPKFSESKVLCNKVDGVVLVVRAGRTRREVALRAKREIEEAGGKILGVVLNRHRYHIPEWIYKRL